MPTKRTTPRQTPITSTPSRTSAGIVLVKHDREYPLFEAAVRAHRASFAAEPVFLSEGFPGVDSWKLYLSGLPGEVRQLHNCSCCKDFIRRFAGLVRVREDGALESVLWAPAVVPKTYVAATMALATWATKGKELRPAFHPEAVMGTPITGEWKHLWCSVPGLMHTAHPARRQGEVLGGAESVGRFLGEHPRSTFEAACRLLDVGVLSRSEKFLAPAKWLLERKVEHESTKHSLWTKALLLRACTLAPEGFLHPRAGVLGQLFDWISSGRYNASALRYMFESLVGPLTYQRPQAAPESGAIARAERLFAEKGLGRALERRFATLAECEVEWFPKEPPQAPGTGLFGHLTAKHNTPVRSALALPRSTLTWVRFQAEVLPRAKTLEALMTSGPDRFFAFTGPVDKGAPGLFKWPNPFAFFCYPNGSRATQWGLRPGHWTPVEALSPFPNLWDGAGFEHLAEGTLLILRNCVDTIDSGLGLFPELLRSDLFEVRSVMEAHSRSGLLGRPKGQLACGLGLVKGGPMAGALGVTLRVDGEEEYFIDRWH